MWTLVGFICVLLETPLHIFTVAGDLGERLFQPYIVFINVILCSSRARITMEK